MATTDRQHHGWSLREYGPDDADASACSCSPGASAPLPSTTTWRPSWLSENASLRLIGATLPGHGGTPPPDDLSFRQLRAARGGAPHATWAATSWSGTAWAPTWPSRWWPAVSSAARWCCCRRASAARTRRCSSGCWIASTTVLGSLPYRAMLKMVGAATKELKVSEARRAELAEDMRKNDPRLMRRLVRAYLTYLDGQSSAGCAALRLRRAGLGRVRRQGRCRAHRRRARHARRSARASPWSRSPRPGT